jgi:hypothetical protein
MKGVIPPNEEIKITIEFCPTSLSTAFSEFEFHVNKYDNNKIVKCTLVGSSARLVAKSKDESTSSHYRAQMSQKLEKTQQLTKTMMKNHNVRAQIHDQVFESERLSTLKKQMDSQFNEQETYEEPLSPNIKTSKSAKSASTFKTKLSASILKSKAWGTTLLDEEQTKRMHDRKLKELELEHIAREYSNEQQAKKIKWFRSVGDTPMSEEEIQEVLQTRQVDALKRALQERESSRERKKTETKPTDRPTIDNEFKENIMTEYFSEGTILSVKVDDIGKEKEPTPRPVEQKTTPVVEPVVTPMVPPKTANKKKEPVKEEKQSTPRQVSLLEPSPLVHDEEKGKPKLSPLDPNLIKISEFPQVQSNASVAPLGNYKVNDPVFKDMEILQLKVPLYYKIAGYKSLELTPIETYIAPRVPIDYTLSKLEEHDTESATKMYVDPAHVQSALKLQQCDRYYIPVNEYNDRIVPLKPQVLTEFDVEYYLASKNQNILFDLILEEKRQEKEKEPYMVFRTFSNRQPEPGEDDNKPLKQIVRRTQHPLVSLEEQQEIDDLISSLPSLDTILSQTVRPRQPVEENIPRRNSAPTPVKKVNILADIMKKFGTDAYYPELQKLLNPDTQEEAATDKKKKEVKPKSSKQPVKPKGKEESRATSPPKTAATEVSETPQITDQQIIDHILMNLTPPTNRL